MSPWRIPQSALISNLALDSNDENHALFVMQMREAFEKPGIIVPSTTKLMDFRRTGSDCVGDFKAQFLQPLPFEWVATSVSSPPVE